MRKTPGRTAKPSPEALKRSKSIKDGKLDYADIPVSTADKLKEIKKLAREKRQKKMFSLRITVEAINWWKETLGKGYTGAMARLLEIAKEHPSWIEESRKK